MLLLSSVLWAGFACAQEANYPTKPITLIVPYGPGGIVDVGARIFVDSLSRELKVPVIIANRPGGSGIVGAQAMLNANPNGYTLLATAGASIIAAVQLSKELPFDPRKDMAPIAYIADAPVAMSIGKSTPINSFAEFVQYRPGESGKAQGRHGGDWLRAGHHAPEHLEKHEDPQQGRPLSGGGTARDGHTGGASRLDDLVSPRNQGLSEIGRCEGRAPHEALVRPSRCPLGARRRLSRCLGQYMDGPPGRREDAEADHRQAGGSRGCGLERSRGGKEAF